jgi:metal-responsive CopG/Arc/MetJ family transcriptional regulator
MNSVKTAISVPKDLFELSERLAKKLKVSRSQIFAMGVKKLGEEYDEEEIISSINRVCETVDTSVDPVLFKMAMLSLPKEEW